MAKHPTARSDSRWASEARLKLVQRQRNESFKPGEKVIWLKRLPGGPYVFPVNATVMAVTAKRVRIEADDDGEIVIRYVSPQSLQRNE